MVYIKEECEMPEISLFYGIRITMYYEDHNPPYFHAEYNGNKAVIDIDKVSSSPPTLIFGYKILSTDL